MAELDRVDVDKIYFISRLLFDIDIDQKTVYQYKDIQEFQHDQCASFESTFQLLQVLG